MCVRKEEERKKERRKEGNMANRCCAKKGEAGVSAQLSRAGELNVNGENFDNRKKSQIALTYSSILYSELDIASGSSCLSRRCASSRALWLRKGVHDENTRLSHPC